MAKPKTTKATTPSGNEDKNYFIVNPKGAVHEVPYAIARQRLQQVGYRIATKAEIAKLSELGGKQTIGKVAGQPHVFDPEEALNLEALAAEAEETA